VDIPASEYEQRRSIFQLCDWINSKLRDLEERTDFEERYFERRGQNIKKLLEEAIPVARLGLYFWRPWRDISVACLAGNQPHDAKIMLQDPHEAEKIIKIEVTSTETDETAMRRQALSRDGFAFMTGPVRREGRRIVSEPNMVDVNEERKRLLECAFERFRMKAEQEDDPETAILVYINSFGSFEPMPFRHRARLLEQTRNYLRTQRPELHGVYYCYQGDQGVDGLRNKLSDLA
jgi:hypothetical protein